MTCRLCNSKDIIFIKNFKPYLDRDWVFEMYECNKCSSRYCLRDNTINYHEEIHSLKNSPYEFHYNEAQKMKKMFPNLNESKIYLSQRSPIFSKMIKYLEKQPKTIKILEIGCSTGYVTAFLQKLGFINARGIDISTSVIEYATKTFGNYYSLKEEQDTKYDLIFHSGLIGCVESPLDFMEHYLSLLNKVGVMFFNSPDVDSIKETEKIWVSTPPPDLIYLFKYDFWINTFSDKYQVEVQKTITPSNILYKNLKKQKGTFENSYPKKFILKRNLISEDRTIKKIIKKIVFLLVLFFVKVKILKKYSDEYGILCRITKVN